MKNEQKIRQSSLIVIDGNIPQETVDLILELSNKSEIPVWFEPTDVSKSIKPFKNNLWKSLYAFSPNFNELRMMAIQAGCAANMNITLQKSCADDVISEVKKLADYLVSESINATALITLGKIGLAVIRRGNSDEPFLAEGKLFRQTGKVSGRLYPAKKVTNLVNVTGAGDCLAAGFIQGMLLGLSEEQCVSVGLACAKAALSSEHAVPLQLLSQEDIYRCEPAKSVPLH